MGALPNPSLSEGKSDIIGVRFVKKTHLKRIRRSSNSTNYGDREPRTTVVQ